MELIRDKTPEYVYNKHTTYENTILQEHAGIVNSLKDISAGKAMIEPSALLFIGLCMKDKADKFVDDNYKKIYDKEYNDAANIKNDTERHNYACNRAWLRLMNMATTYNLNKYKTDGSKAKLAILDNVTSDGRLIVDADDLDLDKVDFSEE
jgi:hypothetical protein